MLGVKNAVLSVDPYLKCCEVGPSPNWFSFRLSLKIKEILTCGHQGAHFFFRLFAFTKHPDPLAPVLWLVVSRPGWGWGVGGCAGGGQERDGGCLETAKCLCQHENEKSAFTGTSFCLDSLSPHTRIWMRQKNWCHAKCFSEAPEMFEWGCVSLGRTGPKFWPTQPPCLLIQGQTESCRRNVYLMRLNPGK